ncbi:MAG: oxygenase MpaB family protein [Bacteroidota bacterium]
MKRIKPITQRIAQLDAQRDHQEIAYLLTCYVFPWDIERALEFALFRTFAIPLTSEKLVQTGELIKRPQKRYDDTELIMYTLAEHGYDSELGRKAIRRMNQMHGRYPITNDEMLYVLSTFIYEPNRWLERYGWRVPTENEKLASFYFYREVGRRMNIKDIPDDYHTFEQFNIEYERQNFGYSPSNRAIGDATCDLFLGFYLPKPFWPLGRPLLYAMMDKPLLDAFGFPHPTPLLRKLVIGSLRLRSKLMCYWPEPNKPVLGTQRKRPTYPEGYKIEELGTFDR